MKAIPQQGIQLLVAFPDGVCRKSKKVDVEMMMKRKINRVKKEYQVYMHKVHVLCWIGHGNFVSRVLNDQELMAAALSLVPSKECYPGDKVDIKYVEQITTWYKDKLTLKQDKNEDKFKPKAPPLKTALLEQIKNRVTTKKYLVFIFVTMLRALGLQCRIMFNFVTLPIKPPTSELCSLATKPKDEKATDKSKPPTEKKEVKKVEKVKQKAGQSNAKASKQKIVQVDGNDDSYFCSDDENIMQVDGSDDTVIGGTRKTRSVKRANENSSEKFEDEDVSPPKVPKKRSGRVSPKPITKKDEIKTVDNKRTQRVKNTNKTSKVNSDFNEAESKSDTNDKKPTKSLTRRQKLKAESTNVSTLTKLQIPEDDNTASTSKNKLIVPKISVTNEDAEDVSSEYFNDTKYKKVNRISRKRSHTANPDAQSTNKLDDKGNVVKAKTRTKSAPNAAVEKSKYFEGDKPKENTPKRSIRRIKKEIKVVDIQRVSHRDLAKVKKGKNDVTGDLVDIIKNRIKEAKSESQKGIVKGKKS